MKIKSIFINLSRVVIIICLVLLYLWFYVLPSLDSISRQKRELKDMKSRIENFKESQKTFPFPDAKENTFFKNAEQELKKHIPVVRNKEDYHALLAKVSDYIKKRAREDGIANLRLIDRQGQNAADGIHVHLSFSGPLRSVVNFINHLSWADYHSMPDIITAVPVRNAISYAIDLKIYTIDSKDKISGFEDRDFMIDFESPLLIQKVYENPIETYKLRKLPSAYGNGILK